MSVTGPELRGKVRNRQVECKGKRLLQQRGIDDIEWYLEKSGSRKILPNLEISDLRCLWWVLNSFSGDFWVSEFWFLFGRRASEDFSVFSFHLVFWSRIFQSSRVQLIELDQLIKTEKQDSGAQFILGDPGADLYFSSRHLMNKSAFLWYEFLSKRFSLTLHQRSYKCVRNVARFPLVCPPQ